MRVLSFRRYSFLLFFCSGFAAHSQSRVDSLPVVEAVNQTEVARIVQQNKGKVVLVNVWATWCVPCREEMPNLLRLNSEYPDKDFKLILISADDVEKIDTVVRPMLKKFGVDFVSYINGESSDEAFINAMNPEWNGALPTSFVYDKENNLVQMMVGGRSYQDFQSAVSALLKN